MTTPNLPMHYRIYTALTSQGICAFVSKFPAAVETPQGYWVWKSEYVTPWLTVDEARKRKLLRWVSKSTTKRYCYPTVEQAIESFRARKRLHVSILKSQLEEAQVAFDNIDKLDGKSLSDFPYGGLLLGGEDLASKYNFDF